MGQPGIRKQSHHSSKFKLASYSAVPVDSIFLPQSRYPAPFAPLNHSPSPLSQKWNQSEWQEGSVSPTVVLKCMKIAVQSHFLPQSKHSQRAAALINEIQQDDSRNTPQKSSIREAALPPPQRPNMKPLFDLLAKKKDKFNSNCPLHMESFLQLLDDYPSPEFPKLLVEIIQYSAKLGYKSPSDVTVKQHNHSSAKVNTQIITDDINKKLSLNWLKKPPALPKHYYCSPLGFIPKMAEGRQTGWQRIFDLSLPKNQSVNDYIAKKSR